MKPTGIIRRIDELGRIVIPKDLRRTMDIQEGDPLEIYTDREGMLILRKYDMRLQLLETVQRMRHDVINGEYFQRKKAVEKMMDELEALLTGGEDKGDD